MPDIPDMVLSGPTVDAQEIYKNGVFDPAYSPDTLEVLNGGLTEENYAGGINSIPAWACQLGSFARGFYVGFDRMEATYARQLANDANDAQRAIHAGLSARIFLPWDASVLLYGYQGYFCPDATVWSTGGTAKPEYWDLRLKINEGTQNALYGRVPANRQTTNAPTDDPTSGGYGSPDEAVEARWKWINKMGMLNSGLTKGYRTVQVSLWGRIFPNDYSMAKMKTPTGGVWMLAIR